MINLSLKNTPIKEIIFTISFRENVSMEQLDTFKAHPQISKKFNLINPDYNHRIVKKDDQQKVDISLDGYILKGDDTTRIIKASRGAFAFHQMKGYEGFDKLMDELSSYWSVFCEIAGQLTVNNIAVRYVNFIQMEPEQEIKDVINIYVSHPFEINMRTYFNTFRFPYKKNENVIVNLITASGMNASIHESMDTPGVFLDIILNRKIDNETDKNTLFNYLHELRAVKNDLFFKSITELTYKKYNS